ncbi:retropepsin-like aspartic protease family protein [Candidatus Nitrosacidococcus tergens]|uniref:Peptidase A2 domain-containing protein n=1 Tax=Candidatus Nitrosacidococcus tergens TaxID=553981 RepID=A0A7G1QAK1_9GAMM|nr:retropepsin-like aspartic protease [Candidatus Nitrosacidococcus tergens]CAB1276097.1 conserved protein of unknown function [Candidatus Nitrosacidococcus tergens]
MRYKQQFNYLLFISGLWLGGLLAIADEDLPLFEDSLAKELGEIGVREHILIKGLERTRDIAARPLVQGSLQKQIQKLLVDFNYILVHTADNQRIKEILILSEKTAAPPVLPNKIILNTTRSGTHHLVQASIQGVSTTINMPLLVDTGASLVVLPASIMPKLGLNPNQLKDQEIQTANGALQAKLSRLKTLTLGSEKIPNVEAAFIEDQLLGSYGLLGMNVLSQYVITIDDQHNQIVLNK